MPCTVSSPKVVSESDLAESLNPLHVLWPIIYAATVAFDSNMSLYRFNNVLLLPAYCRPLWLL